MSGIGFWIVTFIVLIALIRGYWLERANQHKIRTIGSLMNELGFLGVKVKIDPYARGLGITYEYDDYEMATYVQERKAWYAKKLWMEEGELLLKELKVGVDDMLASRDPGPPPSPQPSHGWQKRQDYLDGLHDDPSISQEVERRMSQGFKERVDPDELKPTGSHPHT